MTKGGPATMIGSLFSGIGGFELGFEMAGLGPVLWQVEIDPWCREVLARHWPNADRSVTDVREVGSGNLSRPVILLGGFPCQDVSGAGRGGGIHAPRSGLWWEFRRVVSELLPPIVVVENVASGARRWLCAVRGSLQELGYRTRALGVRASDVGAPHRRARIFVVAYADSFRELEPFWPVGDIGRRSVDSSQSVAHADSMQLRIEPGRDGRENRSCSQEPIERGDAMADAVRERLDGRSGLLQTSKSTRGVALEEDHPGWPPQPGLGRVSHGLPAWLDRRRWPAGRGDPQEGWEPPRTALGVADRPARLKALGNAVVPQCAAVVALAIQRDILSHECAG